MNHAQSLNDELPESWQRRQTPQPATSNQHQPGGARVLASRATIKTSTIICAYLLAFLIPIAGFFAGVWFCTKKQTGHGCVIMALSILWAGLIMAAISAIH